MPERNRGASVEGIRFRHNRATDNLTISREGAPIEKMVVRHDRIFFLLGNGKVVGAGILHVSRGMSQEEYSNSQPIPLKSNG